MVDKKSAPLGRQPIEQGNQNNITLPQNPEKVKSESDFFQYCANTYCRFLLQDIAQKIIAEIFPKLKKSNYCKCHKVTRSAVIDLKRNPETLRAYYNGICTCATPLLCPVCSPRIMGYRAAEIRKAVHLWLAEDENNTCYLITLTLRHSLKDNLVYLLEIFAKARKYFWGHRTVKKLFKQSDRAGRITATEINFSITNGWHPHQHILLFCKKTVFDIEVLRNIWLNALSSVGISGIGSIAFDLIEARSADQYLTKISSEMVLGSLKDGRKYGNYSPFQLLAEVTEKSDWARDRFAELFQAARKIHPLVWSKGLKARFGIGEVSDQEISDNKADKSKLLKFLSILDDGFKKLTYTEKAALRNKAAIGDYAGAGEILKIAGIEPEKVYL